MSTCSDTKITFVNDDLVPDMEVSPQQNKEMKLKAVTKFDHVQEVQHHFISSRCSKAFRMVSGDLALLKRDLCLATVRANKLQKCIFVVVQSTCLGDDLFRFNATELNAIPGAPHVDLETDKSELTKKVMELKDFLDILDDDNVISLTPKI